METSRIAVLLACHNRRRQTLACLASLSRQQALAAKVSIVLVDDGSSDGTAAAVAAQYPEAKILEGNGELYWARAMALAEDFAMTTDPDFLLWLNDDVLLLPAAISTLLDVSELYGHCAIVCGVAVDPSTREVTYSGVRRKDWHPMRFERIVPHGAVEIADTFNGNVALIPRTARRSIGAIDAEFEHAMADYDYGLRGTAVGVKTVVVPYPIATCRRDSPRTHRFEAGQPILQQWRRLLSPTGLPPRSHVRYLRRHGGHAWLVAAVAPYFKFWLDAVLHRLRAPLTRSGAAE